MESGIHPCRAGSTLTSEPNRDLAVDSGVFKPRRLGWEGVMKMEKEVYVQKRTMRRENEVCLPTFPHPQDGRDFRD